MFWFFWVVGFWALPVAVQEAVRPVDLVLTLAAFGEEVNSGVFLISVLSLIFSRSMHLPVLTAYSVFWLMITASRRTENDHVEFNDEVPLRGWLARIFGAVSVSEGTLGRINSLLGVTTQDELWENKVRVWAYLGDRMAHYHAALCCEKEGSRVAVVQARTKVFMDDNLKQAMRYYGKDWWESKDQSMQGKAAATILEAMVYLVLHGKSEVQQNGIFCTVERAVDSANSVHFASPAQDGATVGGAEQGN